MWIIKLWQHTELSVWLSVRDTGQTTVVEKSRDVVAVCCGRMMGQTDVRLLYRPCFAYYAGSGTKYEGCAQFFAQLEPQDTRYMIVCRTFFYTVSQKKQDTKLLTITSPIIIRFSKKIFTIRLCSKFATNSCLNIPPRFKMSLHYFVKYECQKMASFWNTYRN